MSRIILVIDIGNTNTSIGIYEDNNLIETFRISSSIDKTIDEYGIILSTLLNYKKLNSKIQGAIISSVVPQLGETYIEAILKYLNLKAIKLTHKSKMPISLNLDNNKEIGADRIANATAVALKYKLPAIVIDFGTATTFDIVDKNKCFQGGIIAPGLEIQAKALSQFTSKLPKIKIEAPKNVIGKNSITAMLSGIVEGHKCLISGMIKKCEQELNEKTTVVATGGYSSILFENMEKTINFIDKDLTLYGLKELYYMNYNCKGE